MLADADILSLGCDDDFGQFHFMIQGSNKFLKKQEQKISKMPRSLF